MPRLLAGEILSKAWLVSPAYVNAMVPQIMKMIDGTFAAPADLAEARSNHKPFIIVGHGGQGIAERVALSGASFDDIPAGSTMVIPLKGVMMKDDQWCGPEGTSTVVKHIKNADANPKINSIVLAIDSPGGTVDGTETLAKAVASTKKPIIAHVDGQAASAAMWVASACDQIIASGNTDIIGSIGTMISFADIRPMYEKAGVKFHDILASNSYNKNAEFMEALKGNYQPMIDNILDPTNQVFINAVKANRSGKLDPSDPEVFTGKVYLPAKAKQIGLIDDIGDLDFAVQRAQELSKPSNSNSNHNMKISLKSAWTALIAFLGVTAAADQESVEHDLTIEQLESINQRMSEHQSLLDANQQLTSERDDLQKQLNAANEKITELSKSPAATSDPLKVEEEKVEIQKPAQPRNSWEEKMAKITGKA